MAADALRREMEVAAARLDDLAQQQGLGVEARREHRLLSWTIREGLHCGDLSVHYIAPVRKRYLTGRRWHSLQSVQDAEQDVRNFLRDKPYLPS